MSWTPPPPPPTEEPEDPANKAETRPLPPNVRVYWKHNPALDAELWRRVDAKRITISRLATHQGWFIWDIFEWAVVDLIAAHMHFEDIDRRMKENTEGNLHLNQRASTLHARIKTDLEILMLTGSKMKQLIGNVSNRSKSRRDSTSRKADDWEEMTGQKVEVPPTAPTSLAKADQTANA